MSKLISVSYEAEIHDFDYRGGPCNSKRKKFDSLKEAIKCAGSNFDIFVVKVYSEETLLPM